MLLGSRAMTVAGTEVKGSVFAISLSFAACCAATAASRSWTFSSVRRSFSARSVALSASSDSISLIDWKKRLPVMPASAKTCCTGTRSWVAKVDTPRTGSLFRRSSRSAEMRNSAAKERKNPVCWRRARPNDAMSLARDGRVRLDHEAPFECREVLEDLPASAHDAGERIVGDVHGHLRRLGDARLETAEQRAAAREVDALVHDVGHELRRRLFDRLLDRVDDLLHRRLDGFAY